MALSEFIHPCIHIKHDISFKIKHFKREQFITVILFLFFFIRMQVTNIQAPQFVKQILYSDK